MTLPSRPITGDGDSPSGYFPWPSSASEAIETPGTPVGESRLSETLLDGTTATWAAGSAATVATVVASATWLPTAVAIGTAWVALVATVVAVTWVFLAAPDAVAPQFRTGDWVCDRSGRVGRVLHHRTRFAWVKWTDTWEVEPVRANRLSPNPNPHPDLEVN